MGHKEKNNLLIYYLTGDAVEITVEIFSFLMFMLRETLINC